METTFQINQIKDILSKISLRDQVEIAKYLNSFTYEERLKTFQNRWSDLPLTEDDIAQEVKGGSQNSRGLSFRGAKRREISFFAQNKERDSSLRSE